MNTRMKDKKTEKVQSAPVRNAENLKEKGENGKMRKSSKLKSFIVATGATIKDHKNGLKNIALIAMFIIIVFLLVRKPQNIVEYREVPVVKEVVKEVIKEVPAEQQESNNERNSKLNNSRGK